MNEPRADLVEYRLARARETLEDSRLLADAGRWDGCVNRLYYACFYPVSAILLQEGHSSPKHTGVRGLFNRRFVKTGRVPVPLSRFYNELFRHRQRSDYADLVHFEGDEVQAWLSEPERLVEQLASLVGTEKTETREPGD